MRVCLFTVTDGKASIIDITRASSKVNDMLISSKDLRPGNVTRNNNVHVDDVASARLFSTKILIEMQLARARCISILSHPKHACKLSFEQFSEIILNEEEASTSHFLIGWCVCILFFSLSLSFFNPEEDGK